jgi:hypothetical protein
MIRSDTSDEPSGDPQPVMEALVQALKSFVDSLSRGDARPKSGPEEKAQDYSISRRTLPKIS